MEPEYVLVILDSDNGIEVEENLTAAVDIIFADQLPGPPGPAGPRFASVATVSTATLTPNPAINDAFVVSAQAEGITIANPNPMVGVEDSRRMLVRLRDNGVAKSIAFGSDYRAIGVDLPILTSPGKWMYMGFVFNETDAKWDLVALTQEA